MNIKKFMKEQQKVRRYIAETSSDDLEELVNNCYIFLVEARTELKKRGKRESELQR